MPRIMLLQIFAACPAPAAPQCTVLRPMASNSGRDLREGLCRPPTMKVSVPAVAPPIPPETGASSAPRPDGRGQRRNGAGAVDVDSGAVAKHRTGCHDRDRSRPRRQRRIAPFGSMVITTSAPAAASAARAGPGHALGTGGRQIEPANLMARLGQIGRHRRAHVPQTDEPDLHASPSMLNSSSP